MLSHVYRKKRKKNGKTVLDKNYRGRYRFDGDYQTTDIALGTADKQVAEQKLRDIIKEEQMERAGLIAPKDQRIAAEKPLTEHLQDFLDDLVALGRSEVYLRLVRIRNKRLFKDCSWKFPKDIKSDKFIAWRAEQKDLSPKTLNEYLNALNALLNWMIKQQRIASNPVEHVSKISLRGRQQRRRAFTDDELQRLLAVSEDRKLLYLTACYTGFRLNELRQLCWGDVHFDIDTPFIKARASTTKNGRDAIIPIHPQLLTELLEIRPLDAKANTPIFYIDTNPDRSFKRDLKEAEIERIDPLNRKVDFHALRYTFCTMLARNGASQRMAQELMRHSDPHLTAQIYTDVSQLPTFNAVSSLPWVGNTTNQTARHTFSTTCPILKKVFNAWGALPPTAKADIESIVDGLSLG